MDGSTAKEIGGHDMHGVNDLWLCRAMVGERDIYACREEVMKRCVKGGGVKTPEICAEPPTWHETRKHSQCGEQEL